MTPIPTLEGEPFHNSTDQNRCKGRFRKSASTSVFSCNEEASAPAINGESEADSTVDMASTSKSEDTDGLSLDRLFDRQRDESPRAPVTMVRRCKANGGQAVFYTDVVAIGNGPSGLSLSAFLAGYRPFYDGSVEHPDASLHEKLEIDKSKSLMEQNLGQLCEGLEGRTNHQVSLLYDYLVRPEADMGQENPSTLTWQLDDNFQGQASSRIPSYVPHVVLGKGAVGGTWADLAPEVTTLSFASWLELPAYSFRQWLERDGANFATDLQMKIDATRLIVGRIPCAAIRRYYRDYVRALGLEENIFEYALVTSVRKRRPTHDGDDQGYNWDVHGCYSGGSFHFRCRWVVLATGVTVPRQLGIPGEDDPRILHSPAQLDRAIPELLSVSAAMSGRDSGWSALDEGKSALDPVLIIGDGISAADAIIKCLINGIPVIHSFRKAPRDSQQILSKLSKTMYPEYHTVFQLMIGAATDSLYSASVRTELHRFEFRSTADGGPMSNGERGVAILRDLKNGYTQNVQFGRVAVLIGFEADLSFLRTENEESYVGKLCRDEHRLVNSKSNTIIVDPVTCRSIQETDLYALGPLIGDNFVRFVIGGSLAAAADILKRKSA